MYFLGDAAPCVELYGRVALSQLIGNKFQKKLSDCKDSDFNELIVWGTNIRGYLIEIFLIFSCHCLICEWILKDHLKKDRKRKQ